MTASRHTRMLEDGYKQQLHTLNRMDTPCHRANHVKNFEKVGLSDSGVKLSNVEGSRWGRSGRRWIVRHWWQYLGHGGAIRNSNWNSFKLGRRRHDRLDFLYGVWRSLLFVDF